MAPKLKALLLEDEPEAARQVLSILQRIAVKEKVELSVTWTDHAAWAEAQLKGAGATFDLVIADAFMRSFRWVGRKAPAPPLAVRARPRKEPGLAPGEDCLHHPGEIEPEGKPELSGGGFQLAKALAVGTKKPRPRFVLISAQLEKENREKITAFETKHREWFVYLPKPQQVPGGVERAKIADWLFHLVLTSLVRDCDAPTWGLAALAGRPEIVFHSLAMREQVLQLLRRIKDRAEANEIARLALCGERGSGKSVLLEIAREGLAAAGVAAKVVPVDPETAKEVRAAFEAGRGKILHFVRPENRHADVQEAIALQLGVRDPEAAPVLVVLECDEFEKLGPRLRDLTEAGRIVLPALSERREDIPALARSLAGGKLAPGAGRYLAGAFGGNCSELKTLITLAKERAAGSGEISEDILRDLIAPRKPVASEADGRRWSFVFHPATREVEFQGTKLEPHRQKVRPTELTATQYLVLFAVCFCPVESAGKEPVAIAQIAVAKARLKGEFEKVPVNESNYGPALGFLRKAIGRIDAEFAAKVFPAKGAHGRFRDGLGGQIYTRIDCR